MDHTMSLLNRLDRIPLSRPHYTLLLMGGLGYTFDGMDAAIVAFAAALGFAGVFTMTTAVLLVGVAVVLIFGLSTAGQSLEELSERRGLDADASP
jgi:putative MFS transporter